MRKLCPQCHGKNCPLCNQTGYQGRTGIFELMVANDHIRALIHRRASAVSRVTALAASFVCSVASTRWPVSDAWIAICAVS